jgi:hypothetical protein
MLPLKLLLWSPVDAIVQHRFLVLDGVGGPSRIFVSLDMVRSFNADFILGVMLDLASSIGCRWNNDLEAAKLILLSVVLLSVPVVEVSKQRQAEGSGSPFDKFY